VVNFQVVWILLAICFIVPVGAVYAMPIQMPTGFYYPTECEWTGDNGGAEGDPKQPWNDGSSGGRIYGYLDPEAPTHIKTQHVGIDVRAAYDSPVYAITSGVIDSYLTNDVPKYWCIIVKHQIADGSYFYAIYGHCRLKPGYSVGQVLEAGEHFAYINEPENQHLHFGIRMNNVFSDGDGWGHLDLGKDAYSIGWRPPRTWLLSNLPYIGIIDTIPPSISVIGPDASVRYNFPQSIFWSVVDYETGVKSVTLQWEGCPEVEVDVFGIEQVPMGKHYLTIRATDLADNVSTRTEGPYWVEPVVVTVTPGVFMDRFYVQQVDRSGGISAIVFSSTIPDISEGNLVYLSGVRFIGMDDDLFIVDMYLACPECPYVAIRPLMTTIKSIVGPGLSILNMLVKVCGKVTYVNPDGRFFYIDDGTRSFDGTGYGIRVICDMFGDGSVLTAPQAGEFVIVTGIATALDGLKVIRPRRQSDIEVQ